MKRKTTFEVVLYIPECIRHFYGGAIHQTLFVNPNFLKIDLSAFKDEDGDEEPTYMILFALSSGGILFCDELWQELLVKHLLGLPLCSRSVQSFRPRGQPK